MSLPLSPSGQLLNLGVLSYVPHSPDLRHFYLFFCLFISCLLQSSREGHSNYHVQQPRFCPLEICVRGRAATIVNRHCPPSSSLGALHNRGGRRGRNASFPEAQLRLGLRWERRHCGAHTCELALEVSGAAGCPSRSPRASTSRGESPRRWL